MTFKKYLAAIQQNNSIAFVKEHHADGEVIFHHDFGFVTDETDTMEDFGGDCDLSENHFALYGADGYGADETGSVTYIDAEQQIELIEEQVVVHNRDGLRICLTFFTASAIAHPSVSLQ